MTFSDRGATAPVLVRHGIDDRPFRDIAEYLPILCWLAEADGSIFWYNHRWYDYTGSTPELMRGWGWEAVHHPERLPAVIERWSQSIASGEPFEMTFPLRGADGVFREFLTRAEPIRDTSGDIVRWLGTNTDVSRQHSVEHALRQANAINASLAAEKSAILAQLAEGVIVTDPEGRITFVNAAAERLHGAALLGVSPADYSDRYGLFTEAGESYPSEALPLARAVTGGEVVTDARWRIRRPDGSTILAVGSAAPVRAAGGEQVGAVLTMRDETARVAAEQSLQERETTLRALFETAGIYFAILDLDAEDDFRFVYANGRMAAAWGVESLDGRSARSVTGSATSTQIMEALRRGHAEQRPTQIEYPWRTPQGLRWFVATVSPLPSGPAGHPRVALGSLDITERRTTEAALAEALEAKDILLHEVNHRVKNSLQLVTSLLTLQSAQITDPELRQSMLDARARVGVVASIHQRLYSASQHDRVDFTDYIEELARETLNAFDRSGNVVLEFDARAQHVVMLLDKAVPLALVVSELLTNAVKYAFDPAVGGTLQLALERTQSHIVITVRDTGRGLPAGFDVMKSRGLGMKIVRTLMKQLRGEVAVTGGSGGATFRLMVPAMSRRQDMMERQDDQTVQ
jgi:PAS domain S-box-containing protein